VIRAAAIATASGERGLGDLRLPLDLDALLPGAGPWVVELGFGKGRYLLRQALERPGHRFLGIEVANEYWRRVARAIQRRRLGNLAAIRGEALFLISAVLPRGFAREVHVYFPDPWPKTRHRKRRLFDPQTVDLVLGMLRPDGELSFATDFEEYGEAVEDLLRGYPGLEVERREEPWPEGPRTNYEAKFGREGRPIVRLVARRAARLAAHHPAAAEGLLVAGRREAQEAPVESSPAAPGTR